MAVSYLLLMHSILREHAFMTMMKRSNDDDDDDDNDISTLYFHDCMNTSDINAPSHIP